MKSISSRARLQLLSLAAFAFFIGMRGTAAQTVASSWIDQERAKSRLVAGQHEGRLVAFFEIDMPEGWKTYWRNPGDAGGLPPSFDFAGSENAGPVRVLYPAPKRLADKAGETIGYKGHVLFPVQVEAKDSGKPVKLHVAAHFGVCREICVPLEATHELEVPPGVVGPVDGALLDALGHVPRPATEAKPGDPKLISSKVEPGGPARIVFEAAFPGGTDGADIFVEAPEGLYVPMPQRSGSGDGPALRYVAAFSSEADLKALTGQPLKVTLVSDAGESETMVTLAP